MLTCLEERDKGTLLVYMVIVNQILQYFVGYFAGSLGVDKRVVLWPLLRIPANAVGREESELSSTEFRCVPFFRCYGYYRIHSRPVGSLYVCHVNRAIAYSVVLRHELKPILGQRAHDLTGREQAWQDLSDGCRMGVKWVSEWVSWVSQYLLIPAPFCISMKY